MPNKNEIDLENEIMKKVLSGKVNMKPKWYFVLGSILSFTGLVGTFIGTTFLANLVLFLIRKQGPGTGRLIQMLESFPIWVPLLAILFMGLGIWLLKKYDFSYKHNFMTLVIVLVVAIILSAIIINALGLNEIWSKKGPMKRLYTTGQVYYQRHNK